MNNTEVLTITGVDKSFPGVKALSDVHLGLRFAEVHAVCGENGAGKSTLMKIISGVHKPDRGTILLNGEEFQVDDPNEAYAKGIAIIYQESSLFPDLTVLENIFMGHELRKPLLPFLKPVKMLDYPEMRTKAKSILDRLGLQIDLDIKVSNLGVATKQMVEIAKALTFDSQILILDEPTAALTNREVDTLFALIRRLKEHDVSMLYISHRLDEVFEIADRVTVLRDGQYVNTSEVKEATKDQLVSWMVGRALDNLYPKEEVEIGDVVFEAKNISQEGVLKGVNIDVRRGEILGIAGLAGSGRTELALAMVGLAKPDSGEVYIHRKRVRIPDYRTAMENSIVYISEDRQVYGLILPMSLRDNITHKVLPQISNSLGVIDREKQEKVTSQYMGQLAIKAPNGDFIVNNLSGGNQQKVSVAKSLAVVPEILILDEPTRGVDVGAKAELHRIITGLAKEGKSIVMISSDLPEILGMCDRVVVMRQGSVAGEVMRDEMTQEIILDMAL